ncbi:MAG: GNAT family N-acetyltransferase [Eubacteriales bacterium]
MILINDEILRIAMNQHAIDANCSPDDFMRKENVVVISKPHEKARRYLNLPFFCDLISYGSNIVASVDARIYDFVCKYIDTKHPEYCFETPQIHRLTNEFIQYGYLPCYMAEYWLPDTDVLRTLSCKYDTRVLEHGEFDELYLPEWSNALSENRPHLDMLAVGAYDGELLIGLAGCSADCDTMWQIGIDVLLEYRRQGVASALTSRLAHEVLNRGIIPFYCCAWSNLSSVRNAIKSGFRPAWVEHTAIEAEKALQWNTNLNILKKDEDKDAFWSVLDKLIEESEIVIDRLKGTKHPRFDFVYPFDYGYLKGTFSPDCSDIDVWRGSLPEVTCDAVICTIDLLKRDSEIKLLLGCSKHEKEIIMNFHNNSEYMKGIKIERRAHEPT